MESLTNAKKELIFDLGDIPFSDIVAVNITYKGNSITLHPLVNGNHNAEDLSEMFNKLDFNYDSGFGIQNIDGTIWLTKNRWMTRSEYDGSEEWEFHRYPDFI